MPRTRRPLAADVVAADAELRAGRREHSALRTLQPTADQVLPIRHALEPELLCDRLVVAVELYGTRPEIRSALGLDGQQAVAAVRRNTDDDRDGAAGGGNRDVGADPERGITAGRTWNDGCGEEQRRGYEMSDSGFHASHFSTPRAASFHLQGVSFVTAPQRFTPVIHRFSDESNTSTQRASRGRSRPSCVHVLPAM